MQGLTTNNDQRRHDKWLRALGQTTLAVVAITGLALSAFEFGQSTRTSVLRGDADYAHSTAQRWVLLPTDALPRITLPTEGLRKLVKREPRRSFHPYLADVSANGNELQCLTQAVYYEARGESRDGQLAVAQVVVNRAKNPAYPRSICGVVFQGKGTGRACQFSFACDGSTGRRVEARAWARAEQVAQDVLSGNSPSVLEARATHFHTTGVRPSWSRTLVRVAQVGAHVFYRLPGSMAERRYHAAEAQPVLMPLIAPGAAHAEPVSVPAASEPAPAPTELSAEPVVPSIPTAALDVPVVVAQN
jgi:hypothetical protein